MEFRSSGRSQLLSAQRKFLSSRPSPRHRSLRVRSSTRATPRPLQEAVQRGEASMFSRSENLKFYLEVVRGLLYSFFMPSDACLGRTTARFHVFRKLNYTDISKGNERGNQFRDFVLSQSETRACHDGLYCHTGGGAKSDAICMKSGPAANSKTQHCFTQHGKRKPCPVSRSPLDFPIDF